MKRAYDVKHWKCTKPEMPVLFISGAEDPCMGNVRQFAKAVRAMRRAGYRDVRGNYIRECAMRFSMRKNGRRFIMIYLYISTKRTLNALWRSDIIKTRVLLQTSVRERNY